jgi:hypothetical protein
MVCSNSEHHPFLAPLRFAMELANAMKQMRKLVCKQRIIIVVLDVEQDAFKPSQIVMPAIAATAILHSFAVNLLYLLY